MIRRRVLIDTGPLVAMFRAKDVHHAEAQLIWDRILHPVTCWPVITEAAYLIQYRPDAVIELLQLIEQGEIKIEPIEIQDLQPIQTLLARYSSLKLQLADACLLQIADRLDLQHIFTFDQRDFTAAQTPKGRALKRLEARP